VLGLSAHRAVEVCSGLVLVMVPFLVDAGGAGTIVAIVLGVLLVGLGLRGGAGHVMLDRALSAALIVAAFALIVADESAVAAACAAAGIIQAALSLGTRYVDDREPTRATTYGAR
jgi:hypothetical protein